MAEEIPKTVSAQPTKDFFISILTKDIELIPAILDLIDNSLDGARRISRKKNFEGLRIKIEIDKDYFKISDNCGGIPKKIAIDYAFRFGRPEEFDTTGHTIGQFGIGMKRAFFKMGSHFKVNSYTTELDFSVECDVEKWKKANDWEFSLAEIERDVTNDGTTIVVDNLHKSVSQRFTSDIFISSLKKQVQSHHRDAIAKGLGITVNDVPLGVDLSRLLSSDVLRPAFKKKVFYPNAPNPLNVAIYAGVADGNPSEAGWYVFSNGRLLLESDRTIQSGWGEGNGKKIPQFHNSFARFRGYVFFESDNPKLLPCNTTKTGVDLDSGVYKAIRVEMINLMSPVIIFLREIAKAKGKTEEGSEGILKRVSGELSFNKLDTIEISKFVSPNITLRAPEKSKHNIIKYDRLKTEVDKVKKKLKVTTNREVGEKTFEYYVEMEIDD